jgi:hypothetical protein
MVKRPLVIAALIYLLPHAAYSDTRINFRVDLNRTNVEGAYNEVGLDWQGIEVEFEKEFTKTKTLLSGFSFGFRRELFYAFTGFGGIKDVDRWDEGTYLVFRIFRSFDPLGKRSWSIGPSFAILYGVPGTTLDRTIGSGYGEGYAYTHVFPMRNTDMPKFVEDQAELVANAGVIYPEAAVTFRKRLANDKLNLDWIGGVRIIRFGIVDSNSQGHVFAEKRVLIPFFGMRVGFKIF